MTEEVTNPTFRQMEFAIQLPDREHQFEKCQVIRPITVQTVIQATVTKTDELGNIIPAPTTTNDAQSSTDQAPVTKDDGNGNQIPITGADLDAVTQDIVQAATWGLGCPGNCGHFWNFTYDDMVPQILTCPVCSAQVTLVATV